MIYICCGMHRSGSTWQYRVVKEILRYQGQFVDAGWIPRYKHFVKSKFGFKNVVLKTHSYDKDFCRLLNKNKAIGLHSVRDPRDIVVSLIQMKNMSYSDAMSILSNDILYSTKWSSCKNLTIIQYEDIMNKSHFMIYTISSKMNCDLSHDDISNIDNECGLKKAKDIVASMDGLNVEYQDKNTLLHPQHIYDAKIGKWKNILPKKIIKKIENKHAQWMNRLGYNRDENSNRY